MSVRDAAERLAAAAGSSVWLAGAGVSHPCPSHLPLGATLAEAAASLAVDPELAERIRQLYSAFGALASGKSFPRPETVFETLRKVHGDSALNTLGFMRSARPNAIHDLLGEAVRHGSPVFTTNFDLLIEARCNGGKVVHLHGSVADITQLAATIERITRPLPPALERELSSELRRATLLIAIGYSGSDSYDVTPALMRLPAVERPELLWIQNVKPGALAELDGGAQAIVSEWGKHAHVVYCDSADLGESLGFPFSRYCRCSNSEWWRGAMAACMPAASDSQRALVALAVLDWLRCGRHVRFYERQVNVSTLSLEEALLFERTRSRRLRVTGHYSQCARATLRRLRSIRSNRQLRTPWNFIEELLTHCIDIRDMGQRDARHYFASLIPLTLATALILLLRWSGSRSEALLDRLRIKRFQAGVYWAQFLLAFPLLRFAGRLLRDRLLKATDWEAEHRNNLLLADATDDARTEEARNFNANLEGLVGTLNAARRSLQHRVDRFLRTGEGYPEAMLVEAWQLRNASWALLDWPGVAKADIEIATLAARNDVAIAERAAKRARRAIRFIDFSYFTRRSWMKRLLRAERLISAAAMST